MVAIYKQARKRAPRPSGDAAPRPSGDAMYRAAAVAAALLVLATAAIF